MGVNFRREIFVFGTRLADSFPPPPLKLLKPVFKLSFKLNINPFKAHVSKSIFQGLFKNGSVSSAVNNKIL